MSPSTVVPQVLSLFLLVVSLALFAQALLSLYLTLYAWERPERLHRTRAPRALLPPRLSFTAIVPARHEEAVIYDTVRRVWSANYPTELLELVVVCSADDPGTIAEAQRAARDLGSPRVRVETFFDGPINKPHGLNVGFRRTTNQVVAIFDAEDDIHPDIFRMVNTVMLGQESGIVQAGVQLMNFRDHWFSLHNCLEYFFWFKSRLHFHASAGVVPLGGNTVFIRRELIARIGGWDEDCLAEDADIGLRLSVLGEPIQVVYDAEYVTREETPGSIGQLIKQRTRWHQGFVQVLRKPEWRALPRAGQRLLALYTLAYPIVQAIMTMLLPVTIAAVVWLRPPVVVAMVSLLPLYALLLQLLASLVGSVLFAREYGHRLSPALLVNLALTFLPYQWLLGISAVRAVTRELRRQHNWEKTAHNGAHRQTPALAELGTPLPSRAHGLAAAVAERV
jgi:cellulose synthase/poly-beta-1,6-N-acetylglucosamine synthase-like glycosyltransferase